MNFFFDQLVLNEVKIDERVKFRSANQEIVADQILSLLPKWSNVNIHTKGCCPLFLFIQHGEIVAEVSGCDSPEVIRQIMEYIPEIPKDVQE
mmetsp:Transcript_29578/g.34823  ORF Transcript_29578/g.34823 Transcript_29578/m.34823 type:complete len:92 (+) Transcript_29578:87-362(+)